MNMPRLKAMLAATSGLVQRARFVRQTRLYCVGTAKSGTHSIAAIFTDAVRAGHEPDAERLVTHILDLADGRISSAQMRQFMLARDRQLCLDVDSSQLNFFILDTLASEFDDSLFLLTIRDSYSWLDSIINHSLRRAVPRNWTRFRDLRFRPDLYRHAPEERVLEQRGLYTLDGYLDYWACHNERVISAIPEERLLVVKTDEISTSVPRIADFTGLPPSAFESGRSHAFQGTNKHGILDEIDRDYLEAKMQQRCGRLMERFFPQIRSLQDAGVR